MPLHCTNAMTRSMASDEWISARSNQASSFANMFRSEHRQLPGVGSFIVANEIGTAVRAFQFEVPVVWRQPRVEHLRDGDAAASKNQRPWRLLASMAGVALDSDGEEPLFIHRITIRP